MPDLVLVTVSILLTVTAAVAVEYYRQLRKVQREYEKAKNAVEDIVLSFNRQLKHEAEKLEAVAYKIEALAAKSDGALDKAQETGKRVAAFETKIIADSEERVKTLARLDSVEVKIRDAMASQETVTTKVASLEEYVKQSVVVSESHLEAVIPIRREKAMAQLTETEVSVLELLVSEGAKTAPEIKERVKLSREHTARLMKKLYEEGYLERETGKIPFKYSVKKEMEKLLRKTEVQAS